MINNWTDRIAERRKRPPNRHGCKPVADVCAEHGAPLVCRHGCERAGRHAPGEVGCDGPSRISEHAQLEGVLTVSLGGLGGVALIDAADRHLVEGYRWRARRNRNIVYAEMHQGGIILLMHRAIAGEWELIDHVNQDGLDNRRSNLRQATRRGNMANTSKRPGCSSRFKGVFWSTRRGAWMAQVKVAGKSLRLGRFASEEEAARTYDAAARLHFGEFARANFPLPEPPTPTTEEG